MGLLAQLTGRRTARQQEGDAAEERAQQYLQAQGLRPVARNFRCRGGEIDLVMQSGEMLVFVEVRKRADSLHGDAAASITSRKQARVLTAAQVFLQRYREPPACRIDVIAIDGGTLRWLRDAIRA